MSRTDRAPTSTPAYRDRTLIAGFLAEFFPLTFEAKPDSDGWHGFLNAVTGLDIEVWETNAIAFDKWRQAIAAQYGHPVWGYTKEQIAAIKARGEELKRKEDERLARLAETLKLLAAAAPTKTAQQLIDDTKKAAGA